MALHHFTARTGMLPVGKAGGVQQLDTTFPLPDWLHGILHNVAALSRHPEQHGRDLQPKGVARKCAGRDRPALCVLRTGIANRIYIVMTTRNCALPLIMRA